MQSPGSAWRLALATIAYLICLCWLTGQAAVSVGGTASDFTVVNHATLQPLQLYDYQGKIVVLDFWAYWCGFCQDAAADMEPNVAQYYENNGGNINGVPVQVISISIDLSDLAAENSFISTYGLELVGDDTGGSAYVSYGNGGIPYLVVINGTTNSTNHKAWEVLYSRPGYVRSDVTNAIESVQTTAPSITVVSPLNGALAAAPDVSLTAAVVDQGKIIKRVEFYENSVLIGSVTNPPYNFIWRNAPLGDWSVTAQAVYGMNEWVSSAPVEFTVGMPTPVQGILTRQGTGLVLSWSGGPGLFSVQVATNLTSSPWQEVGPFRTNTSLVLSATNQAAYYRIIRQ